MKILTYVGHAKEKMSSLLKKTVLTDFFNLLEIVTKVYRVIWNDKVKYFIHFSVLIIKFLVFMSEYMNEAMPQKVK